MSGFYLLALIAVWLFVGWVIYLLWWRWRPADLKRKIIHIAIGLILFFVWFGGAFWETAGKKMYWDAKVRKLCAIDGGIKVYETVELPAEMFNQWGQPNFYHPNQGENALGPEYIFLWEKKYYRKRGPQVSKRTYQVIRRSDHKLIGESVVYGRGGGDLPGPWHASSYDCPNEGAVTSFLVKIFHQTKEGKQ